MLHKSVQFWRKPNHLNHIIIIPLFTLFTAFDLKFCFDINSANLLFYCLYLPSIFFAYSFIFNHFCNFILWEFLVESTFYKLIFKLTGEIFLSHYFKYLLYFIDSFPFLFRFFILAELIKFSFDIAPLPTHTHTQTYQLPQWF